MTPTLPSPKAMRSRQPRRCRSRAEHSQSQLRKSMPRELVQREPARSKRSMPPGRGRASASVDAAAPDAAPVLPHLRDRLAHCHCPCRDSPHDPSRRPTRFNESDRRDRSVCHLAICDLPSGTLTPPAPPPSPPPPPHAEDSPDPAAGTRPAHGRCSARSHSAARTSPHSPPSRAPK